MLNRFNHYILGEIQDCSKHDIAQVFPTVYAFVSKAKLCKTWYCSFNMWCLITPPSCSNAVSLPSHSTAESFWRESFWRAWLISCHWASINPALTTSDDCPPALNTTATLLLILQNSGYHCLLKAFITVPDSQLPFYYLIISESWSHL